MSSNIYLCLVFASLILFTHAEQPPATTLSLNSSLTLKLLPSEDKLISIQLPSSRGAEDCLYIHAAPSIADPFQVPLLTVTAPNYQLKCFNAESQFAGLCRVQAQDLSSHKKLSVQLRCMVECELEVEAYLGTMVRLEIGDSIDLQAIDKRQLAELIHVQVPKQDYTLAVMAIILNPEESIEEGEEGVDLLANYGQKVTDPSEQSFQFKGTSLNGGGKGFFIYRNQVPQGELKCLLKIKAGVRVRFSVTSLRGNNFQITFGHSYYDYALGDQNKQYWIDLQDYMTSSRTIQIVFDIYSGNPQFQLSFQSNFTTLIDFPQLSSANSLLLSPAVRSRYNFTGKLYIKVAGRKTAEYYLYTQLVRDDVAYLEPYLAYFDQIQKDTLQNYILFEKYKFNQDLTTLKRNFTFKVEVAEGDGSFHFKRCPTLERPQQEGPTLGDCLLTSPEQLRTERFYSEEIQSRQLISGSLRTIFMEYDVAGCKRRKQQRGWVHVLCAFQVIVLGKSSKPFSFSLLPQRRYLTTYLREGHLLKEYIPRDHYAYFALSLADLKQVEEANIFLTALSGDAALIISTEEQLPTLNTAGTLRQAGSKCNLLLGKDRLDKEVYISVYAYQFTEINLGVVVRRKGESSLVLPLQEGNPHTYLLNKTQPTAFFKFTAKNQGPITVFLNEIAGHVNMIITDKDGQPVQCKNALKDRLQCSFAPWKNSNYSVKVESAGELPDAKFSIAYRSQATDCFSGSLNQPIYITLSTKGHTCYTFNLNRLIDLELTLALPHLQAAQGTLSASFAFNEEKEISIASPHRSITVAEMTQVCPVGIKIDSFVRTCRIKVNIENQASDETSFSMILEEGDVDIALFDGVAERVQGAVGSAGQGKRFYYHTSSPKPIQIFFSTQSLRSQYFLAARFVQPAPFLTRLDPGLAISIYPNYMSPQQRSTQKPSNRHNYYSAVLGNIGLQTLTIDSGAIKEYCSQLDCYLLISVFRQEYEGSLANDEDSYAVEVTQQETVLSLGETKFGSIDKDEVYSYVINPSNAIVQFTLRNRDDKKKICLQAEAAAGNGKIVKRSDVGLSVQVRKEDGIERVFVKGLQDGCGYQVSYISNQIPYRLVRLSQLYQLDLRQQESARFIYYHENPRTFKLVNLITAGTADVYVLPLKNNTFSLVELLRKQPKTFPLVSSFDEEFTLQDNDTNFCSKCYYYILVIAQSRFIGQVAFLRLYDPVPLSVNHVLKQHLTPLAIPPKKEENYIFYALASFNLTFNIISGTISIQVIDPTANVLFDQPFINSKKTIQIKVMASSQKEKIELYSQKAKYQIKATSIDEAVFYVQISRKYATERLFEGFPSLISLSSAQTQTVEFINTQKEGTPLSLMVDVDDSTPDALLTFSLRGEKSDGSPTNNDQLLNNITKADNTYIISLASIEGRYFVDVRSSKPANATFLLVHTLLTHLSPTKNYLFTSPAVFQIYSNRKKVMLEVYNCQGEPSIIGATDQQDFQQSFDDDKSLALRKPNFGGHYVYATITSLSSYFIKVSNRLPSSSNPFEYLINYYYYEDINPYEAVDAVSYDITAQKTLKGELKLTVSPPVLMNYKTNDNMKVKISIQNVVYTAFVSEKRIDLNRYSRCRIRGEVIQKSNSSLPSIILDLGDLATKPTLYVTVEAIVKVSVQHPDKMVEDNSPQELTLLYNTLQVSPINITVTIVEQQYTYWFTDSLGLFVGWMILPFVLAAATLYYLLTYCMRRLMLHQRNMVQEVEIVPSNQTVPTEQKIAQSGPVMPDTGTHIIKQHI